MAYTTLQFNDGNVLYAEQLNELVDGLNDVADSVSSVRSQFQSLSAEVKGYYSENGGNIEDDLGGSLVDPNAVIPRIEKLETDKLDASELPEAIGTALALAKSSGEFDGDNGQPGERGLSILKVTTEPTSYTTATGGKNPIKRMPISTIKTQAGVNNVLVGDLISHSYYLYHVYYLDATYAYMDVSQSIRGDTGATGGAGKDGTDGKDGNSVSASFGQTMDGRNVITVYSEIVQDDGNVITQVVGSVEDGIDGTDGVDGQRGTGILKVTTAPTSYTTETAGVNPIKRMSISTIKTQASVTEVLVGDQISYSYYLYHVYYLDDTYAYMDVYQSIRGATGSKGATGETGPQGPAYALTEADKQEIVEEVLAIVPGGSGGSSNVTTLGDTPIKLTASGVVKLVCASECDYSVKTDTVVIADILNGAKTKVTVKEVDGNYQLNSDGTASAWYDQFLNIPITGLVVGETYNFVFDANGVTVSETTFEGVGHWILKNGSGTTVLTRSLSNVRQVHEFTASTENMYLEWYPAGNYYFQQNKNYSATVRAIYVNRAGTSDLSAVLDLTGTFTGSTTLGTIPAGATISAEPTATVNLITSADSDDSAQKALTDRTVVCFGDSMFGMYRGDNSVPAIVAEYTGATVHNVAFSGCRMSVHPTTGYAAFSMWALAKAIAENDWATQDAQVSSGSSYFPEQLELLKSIDFNDVDMIVIHYGTNDFAAGNAVSIDNSSDPDDYNTLCGALRYSVEKLLSAYPKLQIYVSVPVYRYWTDDSGATTYAEDYIKHGHKLSEFVEALRNTAAEYNLPVIDGFHGMGVNRHNASAYLEDGTHHSLAGRKLFGEYIGGHLMSRQASAKSGVDTAAVNALISAAIGNAIGGSY